MRGLFKRQGQVSLEYISVAVMVIIGITFMGGYVNRAINAYFHDADEQVTDSFQERFDKQAPEDTGLGLPGCICSELATPNILGCGGLCSPTQIQIVYQDCPGAVCAGLGAESYCATEEPSTNESWNSCFLRSGKYPRGTIDGGGVVTIIDAAWSNCGRYSCCTQAVWSGTCGELEVGGVMVKLGLFDRYCGGNSFENWEPFWAIQSSCTDGCSAEIDASKSRWCDPAAYNVDVGAVADTLYVDNCSGDLTALGTPYTEYKCLAECIEPQHAPVDNSTCACPEGYEFEPTVTACPTGYTKYTTWRELQDAVCGAGVDCCYAFSP